VYYFDNIAFLGIKRSKSHIIIGVEPIEEYEVKHFYNNIRRSKIEEKK